MMLLVLFVSFVGVSGACGGSSKPNAQSLGSETPLTHELTRPSPTRGGSCTRGEISLGSEPGIINFVAFCDARASGDRVGFDFERYSLSDLSSGTGIETFSHRPSLAGTGAVGRYGVCILRRDVLGCHAQANGPVRISGKVLVPAEGRCSKRVSLITIKLPPCFHGECIGAPKTIVLVKGRPRGC